MAAVVCVALVTSAAMAQDVTQLEQRLKTLENEIDVLSREIEALKMNQQKPAAQADVQQYGLGAAASKVYRAEQGVSFGGYGEFPLEHPQRRIPRAAVTRARTH